MTSLCCVAYALGAFKRIDAFDSFVAPAPELVTVVTFKVSQKLDFVAKVINYGHILGTQAINIS